MWSVTSNRECVEYKLILTINNENTTNESSLRIYALVTICYCYLHETMFHLLHERLPQEFCCCEMPITNKLMTAWSIHTNICDSILLANLLLEWVECRIGQNRGARIWRSVIENSSILRNHRALKARKVRNVQYRVLAVLRLAVPLSIYRPQWSGWVMVMAQISLQLWGWSKV